MPYVMGPASWATFEFASLRRHRRRPDRPRALPLAGILAVLAWWLRGLVTGVLAFAGFALVDSLDLWDRAMSTLALVATVIALEISVPPGRRASPPFVVCAEARARR